LRKDEDKRVQFTKDLTKSLSGEARSRGLNSLKEVVGGLLTLLGTRRYAHTHWSPELKEEFENQ